MEGCPVASRSRAAVALSSLEHVDYIFGRMFAFVRMVLSSCSSVRVWEEAGGLLMPRREGRARHVPKAG